MSSSAPGKISWKSVSFSCSVATSIDVALTASRSCALSALGRVCIWSKSVMPCLYTYSRTCLSRNGFWLSSVISSSSSAFELKTVTGERAEARTAARLEAKRGRAMVGARSAVQRSEASACIMPLMMACLARAQLRAGFGASAGYGMGAIRWASPPIPTHP